VTGVQTCALPIYVRDRIAPDYLPSGTVRLVQTLLARLPAAVIANSETTARTIDRVRAVSVIPDPYDPPVAIRSATAAPDSDGPRGDLRVVMVGRLAPWKGQLVFLDALARAFPAGGARAVVVGSALFGEHEYEREVRERVRTLGLSDRVELAGFVDDVPSQLAAADVFVHASVLPEPHGQVVVEAMAAGVAVIASAAGGPAEIITPEVDGLLVPSGDVGALAAALRRLADDPSLRRRLGDAARDRAADYRGEVIAPLVVDRYRRVLAARSGRARAGRGR